MDIFYSTYTITPIKRINRTCNLEPKYGVLLKAVTKDVVTFADYFPHPSYGDRGCDQFLGEFKFQKTSYDKKIFYFLNKDHSYQKLKPKKILNHQLWYGVEDLEAKIIKYKLKNLEDRIFLDPLKRGHRLRLDSNGLFSRETFLNFIQSIPPQLHSLIEFVEDPLFERDWSNLGVKVSKCVFAGSPHDAVTYKPNCQFIPESEQTIIFSSHMGSDLGIWHAYCELIKTGDLSLTHGIVIQGYVREENFFFKGNYQDGFIADESKVKNIYQNMAKKDWKSLYSM